jgi:acyl-coenzyme A synthetase/AMP-(fatty) acid ligase
MNSQDSFWAAVIQSCAVSDIYQSVEPAFWPELSERLDDMIVQSGISSDTPICLKLNNSVVSVILLAHLLRKNVSVYLTSGQALHKGVVPPFCRGIISVSAPEVLSSLEKTSPSPCFSINPGYNNPAKIFQGDERYVIFSTSGSTGDPRYVCFRHRELLANSENCVRRFRFQKSTNILIPVPMNHMFGLGVGVLPSLLSGSSLRIIDKTSVLNLYESLRNFKPDICLINPTMCGMLLKLNKSLRTDTLFISAGEKIKENLADEFSDKFGKLVNLYGSTELGATATSFSAGNVQDSRYRLAPLNGISFRLSEGKSGEIFCKSSSGFCFYLNEDGEVNEPLPYLDGWLPTRDTGILHDDGMLEITGRADWCINRSGFLVSLLELEAKIEEIIGPEVSVILTETDNGSLVALTCTETQNYAVLGRNFKGKLAGTLPKHLTPDRFVFVTGIPLLANGKANRRLIKDTLNKNNNHEYSTFN